MFVLVILAYGLIGYIEIVPMIRNKLRKELTIYCILFSCAFILSLLLSLGVDIPSPAKPIEDLICAVFGIKVE